MRPARESRNIRLIVAYDGTDFSGWQRQDGGGQNKAGSSGKSAARQNKACCAARRTVQGELEKALETIHKHPVALTGSGRTDSGVHAFAQCANFFTDIHTMAAERFVPALNSLLPPDVRVREAEEAPLPFHARFDARSRTYRYCFIAGRQALPMEKRYAVQLWRRPDIALLNDYCGFLKGEFDCTVFASPADKSVSRYRYMFGALFYAEAEKIVFEIRANAFLWKMVRSVAGTLLFYEEKKLSPQDFYAIITSGKRELAGPTLPPEGLTLTHVEY